MFSIFLLNVKYVVSFHFYNISSSYSSLLQCNLTSEFPSSNWVISLISCNPVESESFPNSSHHRSTSNVSRGGVFIFVMLLSLAQDLGELSSLSMSARDVHLRRFRPRPVPSGSSSSPDRALVACMVSDALESFVLSTADGRRSSYRPSRLLSG